MSTRTTNLIFITDMSDRVLEAILDTKATGNASLDGLSHAEVRQVMETCGIAYTEAWLHSCDPVPDADDRCAYDGVDYEALCLANTEGW